MAKGFEVRVVTPEREVLSSEARFVILPAFDGEMGILPRRAPFLARLGAGLLRVDPAGPGEPRKFFLAGGFAQMVDDRLTLLTEEARDPEAARSLDAAAALAAARAMPSRSEAEFERRSRAIDRARALVRFAR